MDTKISFYEVRNQNASYWYQRSVSLYASASVLSEVMSKKEDKNFLKNLDIDTEFSVTIGCVEPYYMLFGLSYELMLKAICIQQKIKFDKNKHDLSQLLGITGVSLSDQDKTRLVLLSEFISWKGRYPTPKKETVFNKHSKMMTKYQWKDWYIGDIYMGKESTDILDYEKLKRLWKKLSDLYSQQRT